MFYDNLFYKLSGLVITYAMARIGPLEIFERNIFTVETWTAEECLKRRMEENYWKN